MRKALLLSLTVMAIWILPLWSATIHVPGDYSTIQAGINASVNGDTVLVAPGIYREHITFNGKAILLKSLNGPDETIIEKVIDGMPIIRFENGEGPNSVLNGFTIRNSNGAPALNMSYAGPTIVRNIFINNVNTSSDGGAINAVYGPVLRIIENIFENNSSVYGTGGGVRSYGIDLIISGNIFRGNNAGTHGGAVHLRASNESIVDHNLFVGNDCLSIGGALTLSEDRGVRVFNNTFDSNSSVEPHGAGIAVWYSSSCRLYNNIIVNNSGMGIHSYPSNNSTTAYSDVWNNTIDYDGIAPGDGSISADPLFVGGEPFSYELSVGSPCIDAGDPESPPDPDGSRADMGAFSLGGLPSGAGFDVADVISPPDQSVSVPVVAFGLSEFPIAGLEFHIAFNQSCLQFSGITSDYISDALVNEVDGIINVVWENFSSPISVPEDNNIMALNFDVIASNGSVCQIEWGSGNEVVDTLGNPMPSMRYLNGRVSVLEPLSLSGHVVYYDLQRAVADVDIAIYHGDTLTTLTDLNGQYQFDSLFPGNYLVCPSRLGDDPGVSIADIILIERYLAQLETFDTPYKYIAADVNAGGTVSMADVIKIRRYLAQLEPLPAGNWAFVDSSFAITPANWPQAPCCREANLMNDDLTDVNLIGARRGDVNNSWSANRSMFAAPMRRIENAALNLGQAFGNPGDIVTLNLTADEIPGVAGLELHLSYPSNGLRFIGVTSNLLSNPTIGGGNGLMHLIWENGLNTVDLVGGVEVAAISFEILPAAPELMDVIIDRGELVNREGDEINVGFGEGRVGRLTSNDAEGVIPAVFGLGQNYPNPFNAQTRISFSLSKACHVNLDVFDMTGRKVATLENGHFKAGTYSVVWDGKADSGRLLSSGIYFYQLKTESFQDIKRMLMIK
jgi:parallel beta-helix repeat protein